MKSGLSVLGEFGLIGRIRRDRRRNRSVIVGIGDDAAVFALSRGMAGLVTTDTLVDGTHFDLSYTSYFDLGWKAMAANLSDIAAMAGKPLLAVVSLTLTGKQTARAVDDLYRGMRALGNRYDVTIAGGDVVRGKEFSITVAVIGESHRDNVGLRSGAKPGDALLVTGSLGASQAGLDLLKSKSRNKNSEFTEKHLRPAPRVDEGLTLARKFELHGMIDISDGLASELHHLCTESMCGMVIDQGALPIARQAIERSAAGDKDPLDYCLYGGEEYELLFTLPPRDAVRAIKVLGAMGTDCSVIGQVTSGRSVRIIGPDGKARLLADRGYRHF